MKKSKTERVSKGGAQEAKEREKGGKRENNERKERIRERKG